MPGNQMVPGLSNDQVDLACHLLKQAMNILGLDPRYSMATNHALRTYDAARKSQREGGSH